MTAKKTMGQITKEFAETLLARVKDGKHINTTVWEEEQLLNAWLALHAGKTWPGMPCLPHGPNDGRLLDCAKRIQADTVLKSQSAEYYKRLINVYKLWADDAINGTHATKALQEKS